MNQTLKNTIKATLLLGIFVVAFYYLINIYQSSGYSHIFPTVEKFECEHSGTKVYYTVRNMKNERISSYILHVIVTHKSTGKKDYYEVRIREGILANETVRDVALIGRYDCSSIQVEMRTSMF